MPNSEKLSYPIVFDDLVDAINGLSSIAESSAESIVTECLPDEVEKQLPDVIEEYLPSEVDTQLDEKLPEIIEQEVPSMVGDWLGEHVDPSTGYVVDDSLTIQDAAADAKATGDAITDLNSALNEKTTFFDMNDITNFVKSHYIKDGNVSVGSTVDVTPSYNSNFEYMLIPVLNGDTFKVTTSGRDNQRAWAFTDGEYKLLSKSGANVDLDGDFLSASADGYLIINNNKASTAKVLKVVSTMTMQNKFVAVDNDLDKTKNIPDLYNNKEVTLSSIDMVQGGYNTAGTFDHTSTNRITCGFVTIKRSNAVTVKASAGFKHRCLFFDKYGTFISTEQQSSWHTVELDYTVPNGAKFFRICIAKSDDSDLNTGTDTGVIFTLNEHFIALDHWNLKGKVLSILGDSISTFGGSIDASDSERISPEGNQYTYPGNRCRYPQLNLLCSVNETYWKKIIDYFGFTLGINDSWAGSCVSWNGSSTSGDLAKANCLSAQERIDHLDDNGTPDYILINGGTNDIGRLRTIGTFNTENPTNYTTEQIAALDVTTFANAYRAMLIRLQKTYPNATIIAILPNYTHTYYTPDEADAYNEIIKEACDYFGVKWIDARISGVTMFNRLSYLPDGIHYNAAGMELLYTVIKNAIIGCYQ